MFDELFAGEQVEFDKIGLERRRVGNEHQICVLCIQTRRSTRLLNEIQRRSATFAPTFRFLVILRHLLLVVFVVVVVAANHHIPDRSNLGRIGDHCEHVEEVFAPHLGQLLLRLKRILPIELEQDAAGHADGLFERAQQRVKNVEPLIEAVVVLDVIAGHPRLLNEPGANAKCDKIVQIPFGIEVCFVNEFDVLPYEM